MNGKAQDAQRSREVRGASEFPALIRATDLGEFLTDEDSEEVSDDVLLCCSDLDGPVQPDSSAMELMDEMARRYNVHAELLEALGAWSVEACEIDVLNPCLSGWNPSKPILHWGGSKACRVCFARAVLRKAGA